MSDDEDLDAMIRGRWEMLHEIQRDDRMTKEIGGFIDVEGGMCQQHSNGSILSVFRRCLSIHYVVAVHLLIAAPLL